MRLHKVKDCCCGCTLETGTKIIGWLQLISGIIMTINFAVVMALFDYVNKASNESLDILNQLNITTTSLFANLEKSVESGDSDHRINMDMSNNLNSIFHDNNGKIEITMPNKSLYVGYAVVGVVTAILGLVLLIGAGKRRAHLLKIWIVISLVGLALYVILIIVQVVMAAVAGMFTGAAVISFSALASLLLSYYYIVVVSSFRKEILAGNVV